LVRAPIRPPGDAADRHAAQHGRKPAGTDDRAHTGNGQHGDEAGGGRRRRADRSPDGRAFYIAIAALARAIAAHRG